MRQEGESEIIQIATKIRLGGSLEPFRGKEVQVIHRDELTTGMMKWADQMLCARNETRNSLNAQMRRIYGFTGLPRRGDKIICLRNYWHRHTEDGNVLINGTIATIEDYVRSRAHIKTKNRFYPSFDYYNTKIRTETNESFDNIILDINKIATGEPRFSTDERMDILRSKSSFLLPYDFTYAYAITVWKAQGSEWDKVLLFEEDFPYNKEEKRKFIYTGITRAAKKLIVVLNN